MSNKRKRQLYSITLSPEARVSAVKRASEENRSFSNYIESLIFKDSRDIKPLH